MSYPATLQGPTDLQNAVNVIRVKAQITRAMPDPALRAIVLRATDDRIAAAAEITDGLGR